MKNDVRSMLKSVRSAIPAELRRSLSDTACTAIESLPEYISAGTLLGYYPIGSEPDILPLLKRAPDSGKRVALPATVGEELRFLCVDTLENLRVMRYDIPEPDIETAEPLTDYSDSICIVPSLGLDDKGNRIGYGKGFYDRFLNGYGGIKLGIAFAHTFGGHIPTEEHDVKLDIIVVAGADGESRVIRPVKNQIPSEDGI